METLELLVKLASFGTAGVCVLAVFIVGKYILALPKDSPDWKVSLMRRYQNMCIIIAVICTLAGAINAYFNQEKISSARKDAEEANNNTAVIKEQYKAEEVKTEAFKAKINIRLQELQDQIGHHPGISEETKANLRDLQVRTREFRIKPVEEVLPKPVGADRLIRR